MDSNFDRFGKALASAINMIREQKLDPTEALLKTAAAANMTAPEISFVAAQINNSRTLAHMFRATGADRIAAFPLADAEAVISKLKPVTHTAGADSGPNPFLTPSRDNLSKLAECTAYWLKKTAEAEIKKPEPKINPIAVFDNICDEEKAYLKAVATLHRAYVQDMDRTRRTCQGLVIDIGNSVRRMSKEERARYGRRIVNGFSDSGEALLKTVYHSAGVDDALPQRTSSERVLPIDKVYTDTAKLLELSRKLILLEAGADQVQHAGAGDFVSDFLANSAALGAATKWLPTSAVGADIGAMDEIRASDELISEKGMAGMSPETSARLTGLRTRRAFMDAVLSDPNLRGYPISRLAQAFNDSVQTDPSIVRSPPRLRAGMMQMLQSSVLDPFQLGQMVDVGKKQQSLFKDMQTQREKSNKAVADYGEGVATGLGDRQKIMTAVHNAAMDINEKKHEKWAEAVGSSWGAFKANLEGVDAGVQTAKVKSRIPALVDARLSQFSKDELEAVALRDGFSGVDKMRKAAIEDAVRGRGDSVLQPTSIAGKAMEHLDQIAKEKKKVEEGKAKVEAGLTAQAELDEKRAQQLIDRAMKPGVADDTYLAMARQDVEKGLKAEFAAGKSRAGSLKDLASLATSTLDREAGTKLKHLMQVIDARATAMRGADKIKIELSGIGTNISPEVTAALTETATASRLGQLEQLKKEVPDMLAVLPPVLRVYEKTEIDRAVSEFASPIYNRMSTATELRQKADALEQVLGYPAQVLLNMAIVGQVPETIQHDLIDPMLGLGPASDMVRDLELVIQSGVSPAADMAKLILDKADKTVTTIKNDHPLTFMEL